VTFCPEQNDWEQARPAADRLVRLAREPARRRAARGGPRRRPERRTPSARSEEVPAVK